MHGDRSIGAHFIEGALVTAPPTICTVDRGCSSHLVTSGDPTDSIRHANPFTERPRVTFRK